MEVCEGRRDEYESYCRELTNEIICKQSCKVYPYGTISICDPDDVNHTTMCRRRNDGAQASCVDEHGNYAGSANCNPSEKPSC